MSPRCMDDFSPNLNINPVIGEIADRFQNLAFDYSLRIEVIRVNVDSHALVVKGRGIFPN